MTRRHPNKVMVAGGAVGPFGRHLARSLPDLANEAIVEAVAAARVARSDIAAAFVGNAFGGAITDQESILAQTLLAPAGICGIPMRTIKNACSSGADAVHLGWSAIAYGQYDCVLVLGAEKLTHDDKLRAFKALATATDHAPLSDGRSVFVDINADRAKTYMDQYGAMPEHFARVAAKNRDHARLNDRAAERRPLSVAEVLADRVVVPPLTRAMCGGIADGAACIILVSEDFAKRRGIKGMSEIVASSVVSGIPGGSAEGNATHRAARGAYEASGVDARDIAVAEVHDPTSPQELFDIEDLLFCGRGEAIRLLEDGDTAIGGRIPVNTSGGLTSRGHPVGATGVAQIVEIHEQLTGCAGARQVAGAKVGLAQMAGGLLGNDSAIASVHLLTV
jgi:acetyl-CoA acetyltransferase